MTTTLIREDTGTHAVVRVIDPGVHVSAPYSRAVGLLERWAADERHAVDEFAAWIEGQAAQAKAEMRLLCDELGAPFAWAEFSDDSVNPAELPEPELVRYLNSRLKAIGALPAGPAPPPGDGLPALAAAYRGERDGWTPRPEDFAPQSDETMPGRYALMPRPVEQAGPQGRFTRWLDEQLQHGERWWRGKQAARDRRLGVEE
jgi:hypothetical protein